MITTNLIFYIKFIIYTSDLLSVVIICQLSAGDLLGKLMKPHGSIGRGIKILTV